MDSRKILDVEQVSLDEVAVGDLIAAPAWSRPRLVMSIDMNAEGRTLAMEEPDASRANEHGLRIVSADEWTKRARVVPTKAPYDDDEEFTGEPKACWRRFPNLTKLWAASKVGG